MDNILKNKELSDEDRELLEALLETPEEEVELSLDKAKQILRNLVSSKSIDLDEEEVEEPEEVEETEDDDPIVEIDGYGILRDKIFADLDVEGLQGLFHTVGEKLTETEQRLQAVEAQLVEVKATEDEKVASLLAAPNWSLFNMVEDKADEDVVARLKENLPEVAGDQDNMLGIGFWQPFYGKTQ